MTNKQYALICYLVLMDGFYTKSIDYMEEKATMLNEGLNAFAYLDVLNMERVLEYLKKWKYEIPEVWQTEFDLQFKAGRELGLI